MTPPRTAVRRLALGRAISAGGTFAAGTALTYTIYQETQSTAWIAATMLLTWAVIYGIVCDPMRPDELERRLQEREDLALTRDCCQQLHTRRPSLWIPGSL